MPVPKAFGDFEVLGIRRRGFSVSKTPTTAALAVNRISATVADISGGAVADGASVTRTFSGTLGTWPVSGQEFLGGINGPVEAASNGATFSSLGLSGWAQGGAESTKITTAKAVGGSKSIVNDYTVSANFQFGISFDPGATISKVFIRRYLYVDNPSAYTVGQNKQIRIVGSLTEGGISDNAQPYVYFTDYRGGSGSYIANSGSSGTISPSEGGGGTGQTWVTQGQWCVQEIDFQPDSSAGANDGSLQWLFRKLSDWSVIASGTVTSRGFWSSGSRHRYIVLQDGFYNQYEPPMASYCDDFYATWRTSGTGALPFILIGDASTYASCTKFSICKYTAQSGNDITFTVNKGPLSSLSGAYAYAMNGIDNPFSSTGVAL